MRRNVDVAKPKPPPTATDDEVRVLLRRYQCPVPFHAVRTRFLGNIATPAMSASPMETVSALWGGELPAFDTLDAANELIGALVMGLGTGSADIRNGRRRSSDARRRVGYARGAGGACAHATGGA